MGTCIKNEYLYIICSTDDQLIQEELETHFKKTEYLKIANEDEKNLAPEEHLEIDRVKTCKYFNQFEQRRAAIR